VLDSVTCITTTQLAKELGMTAQELNRLLCEMHIQYWQSGQYMLYAEYARQGLAKSRTHKRTFKHGIVSTDTYLVWTERGRNFIHQLLDQHLAN
jgi:phage antirepressor YoqD-like protein